MVTHKVRVVNRNIYISNRYVVAQGISSDQIELELDDEWTGRRVFVVLGSGYDSLVNEYTGEPITFPEILIATPGAKIPISIVGFLPRSEENPKTSRIVTAKSDKMFETVESGDIPKAVSGQ